jgi:nucleotide-binding universal stress UspA family protein
MSKNTDLNFEKPKDNLRSITALGSTGPVMLALSTFENSDKAIEGAMEKASQCKKLIIVYGHEVSLWLYFLETDIGFYPCWKEQCEKELLREIHHQWAGKIEGIANRARAENLQVITYVRTECFRTLCMEVVKKEQPSLIITKQNLRPAWFRRLFGSPADYLASHTECSVIEF